MASNAYFAYVFVAAWLGTGKKISAEDIADVMKDVLAKMKPLCELDAVMFAYQHGILHRGHTIASGGELCDYWIVGDKIKNHE